MNLTSSVQASALRAIVHNISSAVILCDHRGSILYANPSVERLLGYTVEEMQSLTSIVAIQDNDILKRLFQASSDISHISAQEFLDKALELLKGKARRWKCRHKAGYSVYIALSVIRVEPSHDNEEEYVAFIADPYDNTNELRNLKVQLLSRISHEIRTPLHGIIGALELLHSAPTNAEQEYLLTLARSKADLLLSLLNDIFEYSHSQRSTLILERTVVDPRMVIHNAAELLRQRIAQYNLHLATTFDSSLPEHVYCDPVRLYQVLIASTSAVASCLKYGDINITIEYLHASRTSYASLLFSIRGQAQYVDSVKKERILNTLHEVDDIADVSAEILQLSLARVVITALGGLIWVDPEVCATPTELLLHIAILVEVHSPSYPPSSIGCVSDASSPPEQQQTTLTTSSVASPMLKRILIADDDPDNCLLAEHFLRSAHTSDVGTIHTQIVHNGKEALEAAQHEHFDIILMDIEMPHMNGFEATEHIRRYERQNHIRRTPILAVTAHTMENYRELCLQHGMDDYMPKPIKKQPFLDMVCKWLEQRYTILVTDDSDDYRLLLKLHLEKKQRFSVIFATNGQEALDICASQQHIDLILLDMQMPILTGYETAPRIRQISGYESIPIWGLTAHETQDEIQKVLESGCNRCFTKGNLSAMRHIITELQNHFALR
ncbi:MAG: response regulator [Bacteroidota bacterium]|nr:response regulator [Candidatus Kapabacteria bacterium]MDW8220304.1 response regulator [Bacteroidota bacterium]